MPRILNTNIYPFDRPISLKDYVIGSDGDSSNKRTRNYLFADIVNLILTQIGISGDNNSILSGSVYWLQDLDFGSTPISYIYDGVLFTAPATELTLSDADETNPRIDVFAIDSTTNTLVVIEGTPAASPQEPTINFETQIRVTSALILSGETEPDVVNEELVYNENTGESTEWETSTTASSSVIDLEDDTDPLLGSVNILCKSVPNGETITFQNDIEMDMDDFSSLNFGIKNLNTRTTNIKIYMLNGSDVVSDAVYLTNGLYGYNNNNTSSYDIINIPASEFRLTQDYDKIIFSFSGGINQTDTGGCLIDRVRILENFNPGDTSFRTWLSLTDTDNTYSNKAGYIPVVKPTEDGLKLTDLSSITLGYIPITGTEVGSPVTGNIEIGTDVFNIIYNDSPSYSRFFIDGATTGIEVYDGTYTSSINVSSDTGVSIIAPNTSKGITSNIYYGANYDDNTYVQKKYVDDNFQRLLESYTVDTLPAGSEGDIAYITDGAAAPTWRGTPTGGGSLKILVFHDGTNWIYH